MHGLPPTELSGKLVDGIILLESCIGKGGFGAVYRAKFLPTSSTVAVKVVPHDRNGRQYWRLKDEIFLHWCMSADPSVITMRCSVKDGSYTYIIMDMACGGNLCDWICTLRGNPLCLSTFARKRDLMIQLIDVIIRCHARNIFHRDLKPENILLDGTRSQIYLSDFGLAMKHPLSHKPRDGTVEFMSPECLGEHMSRNYEPYMNGPSDVWSLGILFHILMFHEKPWQKASINDAHFFGYLADRSSYFLRSRNITIEAHRLLTGVFQHNPEQRLTLQEFRDSLVSMGRFFVTTTEAVNLRRRYCDYLVTHQDQSRSILKFVKMQRDRKCILPSPNLSPRNHPYLQAVLDPAILAAAGTGQQPMGTKCPSPTFPPHAIMDHTLLVPPAPTYPSCYGRSHSSLRPPPLSPSQPGGSYVPSVSSLTSVILQTPEQPANQDTAAIVTSLLSTEVDLGCALEPPRKIANGPELMMLEPSFPIAPRPDGAGIGASGPCMPAGNESRGSSTKSVFKRFAQSIKGAALLS